jgi:transketolase
MRTAFINQLLEEATKDDKIFLIVGDLGFSVVEPFRDKFPERFLNAGVAEQNMTGLAAGLAMEGYTVFTYSIANFPTLRSMEQIRYDVCYHNLNVKIVAVGGGYAYGSLGASHHATEELGMLRTIPNLTVCAPGDPTEAKNITTQLCKHTGPAYIRLGKAGEPEVPSISGSFLFGKCHSILHGKKIAILSTGAMLKYSYDHIKVNKLDWGLFSFPYIKPLDSDALLELAKNYDSIITIEEHQRQAGFGSAILESYHDLLESGKLENIPKIKRIAIPDIFIDVAGTQEHLRKLAGIKL